MKISGRVGNSFDGSYYGYHEEMDAKTAPWYIKFLFSLFFIIGFGGVALAFVLMQKGNTEWFVKTVLIVIALIFILIHIYTNLFDIAKYGEIRERGRFIRPIFSILGIYILLGTFISEFIHFGIVITVGLVILFLAIGVVLWIAGSRKIKRKQEVCSQPVIANCIGFEYLKPHMPILNDADATFAQNEVIARTEVARPVWEFEYMGRLFRATPEEYHGNQQVRAGIQYQIFINPENPMEIYCEESTDAKFLIRMGKLWLVFTVIICSIIGGVLFAVFRNMGM